MDSIFVFIFGPLESVESNSKESALGVRATSAGWGRGARRQAEGPSSDSWNPVKRRVPWAPDPSAEQVDTGGSLWLTGLVELLNSGSVGHCV